MNQVLDGRETKHTPGPWKISHGGLPGDSGFSVASDNAQAENVKVTAECWPCTIVSDEHRQELFANARLIAAAPELLEALQFVAKWMAMRETKGETFPSQITNSVKAAIAKALGE